MGYYQKIEFTDNASVEEKIQALMNIVNWLSQQMSVGRVPNNRKELENNLKSTEEKLTIPLSIAFVKMAEKGEIDEVTASEHTDLFLSWGTSINYTVGDLRSYEGKLYKCLQAHTSQEDWTPNTATSLWKEVGITESGIAEWSQPISSSDAYNTGDEVMYNGVHYRSLIDNNVWSPTDYPQGWEVVE